MRTFIYKELIAEGFTSMGKNNINHPDIIKAFCVKESGHYCEIYKEYYGFSVHLYGKGFMKGYYCTTFDITEQKDVKALRNLIKKTFAENGVYTLLANRFYCEDKIEQKEQCISQCDYCKEHYI